MKWADLTRSDNRTKINKLFDGWPPYTQQEATDNKIPVNVNFKEACVLGKQALSQYENAFLKPENFFTIRGDRGDVTKRSEWSSFVTTRINRVMKRSWPYIQLIRSKFSGVVLHGIGAQLWESRWDWRPRYVAVEDLLIPTDTDTSLENLPFFAVRRVYPPSELIDRTQGKTVDPGWRQPMVRKLLDAIKNENLTSSNYTWVDNPEKMFELYKQTGTFYSIDSAPAVVLWDFFFYDSDAKGWKRRIIQDVEGPAPGASYANYNSTDAEWVYKSERIFARELSNLLHIQFGDLSNKPPFHYHSVRSLGFQLFDVCHLMNRLRCKEVECTMEDLQTWYRVANPADLARLNRMTFFDKGVLQEGIQIVKNEERHQVNVELINQTKSGFRQLMSESSSAYTQDIDTGTQREQTATETIAKVNQVNALMGGLLNLAYVQEEFAYREECRRFTQKKTENKDAQKFQEACKRRGIPDAFLDVDTWEITAERVVGGGNKMLEIAQSKELLAIRPLLDPEPQRKVLHMYTEALSDSKLANELVPLSGGAKVTDSVNNAELSFGSMMGSGVPMKPKPGMNHTEQIETCLDLLALKIQQVMQSGGVGTPEDVRGFNAVAVFIARHIRKLSEDETAKEKVTAYQKSLGKLMNEVKAMEQRQAQQNGNGHLDPKVMADLAANQAKTKQKLQEKEAAAVQKRTHKQIDFQSEQQRKNLSTASEIQRKNAMTRADLMGQGMKDAAEAHAKRYAFNEE
jgi:hypothetical protein